MITNYDKAQDIFEFANSLKEVNKFEEALTNYKKAFEKAIKLNQTEIAISSLMEQERILVMQSAYQEACYVSNKLLQLIKTSNDQALIAHVLNNNGYINIELGNYPNALENLFRALKIREKLGNEELIASTHNNIGLLYRNQRKLDKALEYYEKTLDYYSKIESENNLKRVLNNIGIIHFEKKDNKEAYLYFNEVYKLAVISDDKINLSFSLANIAKIRVRQGKCQEALKSFQQSINLLEEINLKDKKGVVLNYMSECYMHLNQLDKAVEIAQQAKEINLECGAKKALIDSYKSLFDTHRKMEDFERALEYHILYKDTQVELFSQEKANTIKNLELTFEMEKSKRVLQQLEHEQSLLRRINNELKEFTSVASHDMREPLRMISSFSHLLEQRFGDQFDEESLEYLSIIESSTNRMIVLLDDLLIYAMAGYEQKNAKLVDTTKVIKQIEINLQLVIKENQGTITYDKLPVIFIEETLYHQLFQNIISNALKFKKKDVIPVIKINCVKKDKFYHFTVSDNGIGIPKEHQDRVFSIFQKLHHRAEYGGSGIGLATCKKIIDYFGGKIWVESQVEVGSSFHFTLPIRK